MTKEVWPSGSESQPSTKSVNNKPTPTDRLQTVQDNQIQNLREERERNRQEALQVRADMDGLRTKKDKEIDDLRTRLAAAELEKTSATAENKRLRSSLDRIKCASKVSDTTNVICLFLAGILGGFALSDDTVQPDRAVLLWIVGLLVLTAMVVPFLIKRASVDPD